MKLNLPDNTIATALSVSGQTGRLTFTGLTGTNRIKTIGDAADTIIELSGSYSPTGTWNINGTVGATTPATGTFTTLIGNTLSLAGTVGTSAITVTGVTQTTSKPILDLGQTWNASGVVFSGIKSNITNTASASGSKLLDLQIGGSSYFYVDKGPTMWLASAGSGSTGIQMTATKVQGYTSGASKFNFDRTLGIYVTSDRVLGFWSGTDTDSGSADTALSRDSAGVIDFGTGAQGSTAGSWKATNGTLSGTLSIAGVTTPTGGIKGTTTNDNATALNVGEYVSASVVQGSATALTTATPKTVTSISLTAGDWDVTAIGALTGASTGTEFDVAIGTTTNSFTGTVLGDTRCQTPTVSITGADASLMIPAARVSISSTTTYYLIIQETFTVGTPAAYGRLSARRIR